MVSNKNNDEWEEVLEILYNLNGVWVENMKKSPDFFVLKIILNILCQFINKTKKYMKKQIHIQK